MPLSFMNEAVTVIRPGTKTVRGAAVRDWDEASEHQVTRCQVTAASTSQDRDGRETNAVGSFTLRAMYSADIQAGDRVRWRGEVYEVDGDVFHSESPTGRVSSTRCAIKRWEG